MPSSWNTLTRAWWALYSQICGYCCSILSSPLSSTSIILSILWSACHLTNLLSLQYLSCLTTSRSLTDKLAFDVGLQEDSTGDYELYSPLCPPHTDVDVCILNLFVRHRRGLLVDHPPSLQAKVWRREGQGGRWPHSCQCFFRTISGNHDFIYLHCNWQFVVSQSYLLISPPALFSASVLRQWWLDGRCLLHANTVDYDPCDVWMWASWRSVILLLLRKIVSFVHKPVHSLLATWIFSFRFSDRRICAQAVPWSHGRVFGNPRSWPRGRPAQVTFHCCTWHQILKHCTNRYWLF